MKKPTKLKKGQIWFNPDNHTYWLLVADAKGDDSKKLRYVSLNIRSGHSEFVTSPSTTWEVTESCFTFQYIGMMPDIEEILNEKAR